MSDPQSRSSSHQTRPSLRRAPKNHRTRPSLRDASDVARRSSILILESPSAQSRVQRLSRTSSVGRISFAVPEEENYAGLSSFLVACLTTNYISVGYLFLPWAFAHAGLLLTSIVFTVVMGLTYLTSTYVMEACARAEFLAAQEEDNLEQDNFAENGVTSIVEDAAKVDSVNLDSTFVSNVSKGSTKRNYGTVNKFKNLVHVPVIKNRKFEIPDLARVFLGERWSYFFTVTTLIDLYGITWAAAAVFALSLDAEFNLGNGKRDYELFILVFAVVVVPLSFFPVIAQLRVQMGFLCGRVMMVFLMISTTAAAYRSDTPHFQNLPDGSQQSSSPLADFSYLSASIQVAIFSTSYQFSVPAIAEASKNKSKLLEVYGSACTYLFITILVSSLVVAGYLGPEYTKQSCNLNWNYYTGGTGGLNQDGTITGTAWWAKFISYYVAFFPVIDGVSIFSLCAFSLGEILKGFWYGEKVHDLEGHWKQDIVFRLFGCVPQLIGAMFVSDLSAIANYAGMFTILSYTVCPCLVSIYSSKLLRSFDLPTNTRYHTVFSSEIWGWLFATLGLASIAYTIVVSMVQ